MGNNNKHFLPLGGSYSGREAVNQKKSRQVPEGRITLRRLKNTKRELGLLSKIKDVFHKEVMAELRCNGGVGIK